MDLQLSGKTAFVSGEKVRPSSVIKRFATTEEVASRVSYVASPLASATTGAALRVDGGAPRSAVWVRPRIHPLEHSHP